MDKDKILNNITVFIRAHKELFSVLGLLFVCYFLYFFRMGSYPLIDVDETRYVSMAREMFYSGDFMTLTLNGEFFFEKPPLYFWLEALSFMIFGKITEVTARMPVAITATFGVLITYWFGHRIVSRKYALISALILATSFEYIMLARIAILDMLLTVCIASSVICGFYTLFCREDLKKYFWWLAYVFAGFGVLAKGVPGFVLPAASIFFAYLTARRLKELFKPIYIIPGFLMFAMVAVPWHYVMFHFYDPFFFQEYVVKHHLSRFVDSKNLGRKEPWFFLIAVFAACFLPWITSFIAEIVLVFKKFRGKIKGYFINFNECSQFHQFMVVNVIHFLVVFVFFSMASTKLPTYILPAFFPAALLLGKFWYDYIFEGKNEKILNISTIVLTVMLIITSVAALVVPGEMLPDTRFWLLKMQPYVFALLMACIATIIYSVVKNKKILHFTALAGFMVILSMIASTFVFQFVSAFGQDDLIKYAKYAKSRSAPLASFDFGKRYSILYYYDDYVDFITKENYTVLKQYIKEHPGNLIIIKNKNLDEFDEKTNFTIVETGKKYTLVKNTKLHTESE